MVLAEAFAAGTPVVAPDLAAFPELIAASGAGVLAPPGDSAGWAIAVDRLLANEEERRAMGRRARAYYEAELSPAANVQRLTAIYRDAISRASSQRAVA